MEGFVTVFDEQVDNALFWLSDHAACVFDGARAVLEGLYDGVPAMRETWEKHQIEYLGGGFTLDNYALLTKFPVKSIDDLKGKTVVSTAGTTNIKQLTEANLARGLSVNIIPAKDHAEAFLMVETDRAVAFVMDDILLASLVAGSKSPDDYVISKDAFSKPEPYGIMLRKDDAPFKKVVDAATAALYTSGEGQKIYDKWFTQKIPPKGLNLNSPAGPEMKKQFAKPSDSPDPDAYLVN